MVYLRWTSAALLGVFAVCVIVGNAYIVLGEIISRGRRHSSWIPILGGACGTGAILLAPIDGLHWWWWVPLLVDWGCVPGHTHTLVYYLRKKKNGL
jgi:hypothetical protein